MNKLLLNVLILLFIFVIVRYLTYRDGINGKKHNISTPFFQKS